jgi:predicted PurR-regulated permease PerM
MNTPKINKIVVLLVALLISAVFFSMIRQFLMTILLAAIFAGLESPLFNRYQRIFKGRRNLSAALTLFSLILVVLLPLFGLLGIVAAQAISVSRTAVPWFQQQLREPNSLHEQLKALPFYTDLEVYSDVILQKAGELLGKLGTTLFNSLSLLTYTAIYDLFLFFIFLYTMFFFLKDGKEMLERVQFYIPLNDSDQHRLLDRFLSVTRATLKGTIVVGVVQGSLAGLAFWAAGIESAVFWGAVMTVLSIFPVLGPPLVWIPAVVFLTATGHYMQAAGLLLFCSIVVGQIDNILRPILVGRDTQMHELLIFFGTLGGIGLFGIFGFIIGPIVAALFVTVWEIYGETFKDSLADIKHKQKDQGQSGTSGDS